MHSLIKLLITNSNLRTRVEVHFCALQEGRIEERTVTKL